MSAVSADISSSAQSLSRLLASRGQNAPDAAVEANELAEEAKEVFDMRIAELAAPNVPFAKSRAIRHFGYYAGELEETARRLQGVSTLVSSTDRVFYLAAARETESVAQMLRQSIKLVEQMGPDRLPNKPFPVPLWNSTGAQCFFGGRERTITPGLSFGTQGDDEPTVLGVDLYEDFFWGARFTASSALAASDTIDQVKANAHRFVQEGGSMALALSLPLLHLSSQKVYCGAVRTVEAGNTAHLQITTGPRLGLDLPVMGAQTESAAPNGEWSVDLDARTIGFLKVARIFGQAHVAYVIGSDEFNAAIGRTSNDAFGYGQYTLGIVLADVFQISGTRAMFGPPSVKDLLKGYVSIGISKATP